jgi:hypothetical protein
VCDSLDECRAFLHTWNYRRSSTSSRPEIFSKTRLIRADFNVDDARALFLQFDLENEQLVLGIARNDDEVRDQSVILEQAEDGFRLKFWSASGYCVAGGTYAEIQDEFILETIADNFAGSVPVCQRLRTALCDDPSVIFFSPTPEEGYLALEYTLPGTGNLVGCMRVRPNGTVIDGDWVPTGDNFGSLQIDVIVDEITEQLEDVECSVTDKRVVATMPNVTVIISDWTVDQDLCPLDELVVEDCNSSDTETLEDGSLRNSTTCTYPPADSTCSDGTFATNGTVDADGEPILSEFGVLLPENSTYIIENRDCLYTSEVYKTTATFTQKDGIDLLEEMYEFYDSTPNCSRSPSELDDRLHVYSSSYGPGCGFDRK